MSSSKKYGSRKKFAPTGDVTPYLTNDGKPAPGREARLRAGAREPRARSV